MVNKPANISSKDVSRWLIKRLGKLQIGHVGTLDPFAEGVLPILLGKATRLQDYLLHTTKIYEFDLQFGEETNTLDRDGQIIRKMEYDHLTNEMLENFCKTTLGPWEQRTPIYSAVKYKGRALYQYARSGRAEEIPEDTLRRTVFIHGLELLKFDIEAGIGVLRFVARLEPISGRWLQI